MKVLALDTACMTASCAICENGLLLAEAAIHGTRTHSQKLLPMVSDLLARLELRPADMDLFAVSVGPGSFTGLRIGVVTGKGLAFSTNRPLIGVPTLEALAYTIPFWEGVVCPVVDARNRQAFCGFYQREADGIQRLRDDNILHVDALAEILGGFDRDVLMVGDCATRFVPLIQEQWNRRECVHADAPAGPLIASQLEDRHACSLSGVPAGPLIASQLEDRKGIVRSIHAADPALFTTRAAATALLGEKKAAAGDMGDPFAMEPRYMRASQAEQRRFDVTP